VLGGEYSRVGLEHVEGVEKIRDVGVKGTGLASVNMLWKKNNEC
jgi:hypothetical protein